VFPIADPTATIIVKADRTTNAGYGVLGVGQNFGAGWASNTTLTSDAVFGTYSCTVTSTAGLSVGLIVLIDERTGPALGAMDPGVG
jgi:hypothetical protein